MVFDLGLQFFELEVTVFELGLEFFELEVTVFELGLEFFELEVTDYGNKKSVGNKKSSYFIVVHLIKHVHD